VVVVVVVVEVEVAAEMVEKEEVVGARRLLQPLRVLLGCLPPTTGPVAAAAT
jgi:hypothetical protein